MIMEEIIGIYAELAFLDVAFNFGQPLIVFGIFGLDPSLGKLGPWLMKIAQDWRARVLRKKKYIFFSNFNIQIFHPKK